MSQMAIFLLLAAAQIDDRGWQPNPQVGEAIRSTSGIRSPRETSHSELSQHDPASDDVVEPATFEEYGVGYDEELGDDVVDEYGAERSRRNSVNGRPESRINNLSPGIRESELGRNRNQVDSRDDARLSQRRPDSVGSADRTFWNAHDLFLDEDPPFDRAGRPSGPHFRRVDSWAVPIPLLPTTNTDRQIGSEAEVFRNQDGRLQGPDGRRRRDSRQQYTDLSSENPTPAGYRVRDNYFIDTTDEANVRRPDVNARQLNDTDEQLTPIEHQVRAADDVSIRNVRLPLFDLSRMSSRPADVPINEESKSEDANTSNPGLDTASSRSWWLPFIFATLGLFASLGFNLYLGGIAWDIHGRYQEVVEDLSEVESREDDRAPSLLESDSATYSSRPNRAISRRRSISI